MVTSSPLLILLVATTLPSEWTELGLQLWLILEMVRNTPKSSPRLITLLATMER